MYQIKLIINYTKAYIGTHIKSTAYAHTKASDRHANTSLQMKARNVRNTSRDVYMPSAAPSIAYTTMCVA